MAAISKTILRSVANSAFRAATGPTVCYPLYEETSLGVTRPEIIADFSTASNVKASNVQNFTSTSHTPLGVVILILTFTISGIRDELLLSAAVHPCRAAAIPEMSIYKFSLR